jgi:hypothetical protein
MFRGSSLPRLKRLGCGIVGVISIAFGLYYSRGVFGFSYRNWFGGLVFGPFVTLLGIVALLGSIFNWTKIWDSPPREQTRRKW